MPRIISRIIDQYDFEGPPVSGNALVYDSSTQKFKTLPVNSNSNPTGILSIANGGTSSSTATGALAALGAIGSITSTNGSIGITTSGNTVNLSSTMAGATNNVLVEVKNMTGSPMTKGTVVYITGAVGQLPTISKAIATGDSTSAQTLGILSQDLNNGNSGYVTIIGLVDEIDTDQFQDGDQLYLSGTTAGEFTSVKPYAPTHLVYVGVVQYAHQNHGKIFVKTQNGYELDELHDVVARYPTSGQTIIYNSANNLWETNYLAITNSISSVPVSSGIGNDLTLSAGSGAGVGAGGNVILNPGIQGSSGGDGKIIINSDAIINGLTIGKGNNYEIASTAVGISALETNIAGVANTAIGYNALQYNEYGSYNIAIGPQTLFSNIGGDSNIAIGLYSLYYNTEGIANLSLGNNALYNNSIGNSNIALGTDSLNNNISGNYNISIGNYALGDHQSGNNNIGIGVSAGNLHYYGSSNIFIGDNISSPQFTISNFMSIGNLIFASGGFGTATTVGIGNVGIGNPTPTAKLHIVGTSGTAKGLIVQSVSGQTANLQEWSNSSGTALSYIDASGKLYNNNLLALPTSSGVGNNINIIAGSGVISGSGGSVILQAGVQATTGGDGKVVIRQASGQTSNLQEWQTPSGTLKASIKNNGAFLFPTTNSMVYNVTQLNQYGTYGGIIFEDIAGDGRTRMRQSTTTNSTIDFWHGNVGIQLNGCVGNSMFLGGTTWLGATGGSTGSQATKVNSDQATPQGRIYFYGQTYSSSTNHPILTNSYNGYEFYTAVNASWTGGQTSYPYGYKTLSASGHTWKFTSASGSVNPLCVQSVSGQTANLQEWQNSSGTALSYLDASGNFYAVSKSFLIPHPSPEKAAEGRKLRYASLEGPEHAVFFRGNLCNSNQIDLPNYWKDLVHADSITVSLTAKKYAQPNLFVKESNNIKIIIDSDRPINCDYIVYGTRKDVEKLEVETDVC